MVYLLRFVPAAMRCFWYKMSKADTQRSPQDTPKPPLLIANLLFQASLQSVNQDKREAKRGMGVEHVFLLSSPLSEWTLVWGKRGVVCV